MIPGGKPETDRKHLYSVRKLVLLILGITLLAATSATAHDVLVVQGLRVKPFDDAFRGFRNSCSAEVRRVYLPDVDKADIPRVVREGRPKVIVAIGPEALASVRKIRDIPIVYLMVLNPEHSGSGSRNITGVTMAVSPGKYLDLLSRLIPPPRRVGLIYDPARTGSLAYRVQQAARIRGIALHLAEARKSSEVPKLLDSLRGEVDSLLMLPDTTVVTPETVEAFLLFSQGSGVPIVTFASKYVEMGALASLNIDGFDQGRQAGDMARQILEGTAVSALPGEEARKVTIRTNRNVARKLGISLDRIESPE